MKPRRRRRRGAGRGARGSGEDGGHKGEGVLGARMMSPWPPAGLNHSGVGKDDVNERPGFFSVSWRKQWRLLPGITDVEVSPNDGGAGIKY